MQYRFLGWGSFCLFVFLHPSTCEILVPWPGIEPALPALRLNHWITREVLGDIEFELNLEGWVLFTEVIKRRNYILDSIHVTDKCGCFPGGSVVKNLPTDAGDAEDMGSIPGSERSPAGGNGNPFQYYCLENPMDRGAWQATVQGVAKSQTQLSDWA